MKPASGKFMLNDRYDIQVSRPVGEFEHLYADVFEATTKDSNQIFLAYALKDRYPARLDVLDFMLKNEIPSLVPARDYGVVTGPDGSQRLIILMPRPLMPPILSRHQVKRPPISEDVIRRNILRPLVQALRPFHAQGIMHGNIRADNIFWSGKENTEATLGECITSMPGAIQPTVYETIERGMAHPTGRGETSTADDIYAIGILVAMLFRGGDPTAGKSDELIVEEKINRSSFSMMTEGIQLSTSLSEFLRATLSDDARSRWTIDQINMWISGNHVALKQPVMSRKATRVLDFNGNKYIHLRLLARDLFNNPSEAMTLIETGALMKWLDRSLGDKVLMDTVQAAINRANYGSRSPGYEDRLLCFVSMALDPRAPIRYKEIRVLPHGIGGALADAIMRDAPLQAYAECIRDKLAWLWLGYKDNESQDVGDLSKKFDNLSKVILRRGIDSGLERCMYDLLPDIPCLSQSLSQYYILNCQQLLLVLDKIGQDKNRPQQPIDRHIAAFIALHDSRDNTLLMVLLEGSDPLKRSLALLTLFQSLQKRYQVPQLSGLADWLLKDTEFLVSRFHNSRHRRDVGKAIQSQNKNGNLTQILSLVDNPQDLSRDRHEFEHAKMVYARLEKEHDYISNSLKKNEVFGRSTGRQIAAVVSGIMGGMLIAGMLMMKIISFKGGM